MVNYAGYRLVYVAVSMGQKIFGFQKKMLCDKLTTPTLRVSREYKLIFFLAEIDIRFECQTRYHQLNTVKYDQVHK